MTEIKAYMKKKLRTCAPKFLNASLHVVPLLTAW